MTPEQQAVEEALQKVESSGFVPLNGYAEAAETLAAEVRRLRAENARLREQLMNSKREWELP